MMLIELLFGRGNVMMRGRFSYKRRGEKRAIFLNVKSLED